MKRVLSWSLVAAAGCGSVHNTVSDAGGNPDAATVDTPATARRCDPAKPFGMAAPVDNVNSSTDEFNFTTVRDESIAFVGRVVQPPQPSARLLVAAGTATGFAAPTDVATAAINSAAGDEYSGSPVADGLILYFHRQTTTGIGVYAATRSDAGGAFDAGTEVTVDGPGLVNALSPAISADGQTLYWLDYNDFGKVFAATRGATPTVFTNKRAVSTIAIVSAPVLSADQLQLYYSVNSTDVLVSTRANTTASFNTGVPVPNVNSTAEDNPVALSYDGCVLYLSSSRPGGLGGHDIWAARRPM